MIDDGHPYSGWYGKTAPQTWSFGQTWTPRRMVTLGEFGAEALDAYETMRDHYPPQFQPPPAETDTLWAASQVEKHDVKQIAGLGRKPTNLREYIEASQNYQEARAGRQGDRHAALAARDRRLLPLPFHRRGAGVLAEVDRQPRSPAEEGLLPVGAAQSAGRRRCRN